MQSKLLETENIFDDQIFFGVSWPRNLLDPIVIDGGSWCAVWWMPCSWAGRRQPINPSMTHTTPPDDDKVDHEETPRNSPTRRSHSSFRTRHVLLSFFLFLFLFFLVGWAWRVPLIFNSIYPFFFTCWLFEKIKRNISFEDRLWTAFT